jgi:hypothetical protein
VKVVDFGIAKAIEGERQTVTRTGFVVGTPDYMSPEQLSGEPLSGKSDQYALALVAFHLLTGSLPFPGKTQHESMVRRLTERPLSLSEATQGVAWPAGLQEVFDRALARRPDERFDQVTDFAAALGACVRVGAHAGEGAARAAEGRTVEVPDRTAAPPLPGMVGYSAVVGKVSSRGSGRPFRATPTPAGQGSTREAKARHSGLLLGTLIGGVVALAAVGGAMALLRGRGKSEGTPGGGLAGKADASTVAPAPRESTSDSIGGALDRPAVPPPSVAGVQPSDASPPTRTLASEAIPTTPIGAGQQPPPPTQAAAPPRADSPTAEAARRGRNRGGQGLMPLGGFQPTGDSALDSTMRSVQRGLAVVDSIAKLDPDAFKGLRRPAPGARPNGGSEGSASTNPADLAVRSRAARQALDGIDGVIDAAVAGRVPEKDLLRARQAVERLERELGTNEEHRRARFTGLMLQALITRSPADCNALRALEAVLRPFPQQQARTRTVLRSACSG